MTCTESEGMSNPAIIPPGSITLFPAGGGNNPEDLRVQDGKSIVQVPLTGANIRITLTNNPDPIQVTKVLVTTGDDSTLTFK